MEKQNKELQRLRKLERSLREGIHSGANVVQMCVVCNYIGISGKYEALDLWPCDDCHKMFCEKCLAYSYEDWDFCETCLKTRRQDMASE